MARERLRRNCIQMSIIVKNANGSVEKSNLLESDALIRTGEGIHHQYQITEHHQQKHVKQAMSQRRTHEKRNQIWSENSNRQESG